MTAPAAIGPYRVRRPLGAGGMGTVWLAEAPDGRPVAVKVVRPELAADPAFLARFRREVGAARRVAGSCTARVLDADLSGPAPWFASEYVEGPPLDRAVARDGPLPPWGLEGFAVGVAAALTAIHAAGVVHRDLKPSNVLLSPYGPRVIDFGIARALDDAELTRTGVLLGTPGWMAPEQRAGHEAGPAADVHLWGRLVVFAGTGRTPAMGPPDLAGLPPALRAPVAAALEPDPSRRPAARTLLLDLLGDPAGPDTGEAVTRALARTWVLPPTAAAPPAAPVVPPAARAADTVAQPRGGRAGTWPAPAEGGRGGAWPAPAEGGRGGGRGARPRRPWWRRARVVVPLAVVVLLVLGQGGRQTPGPAAVPPTVPAAPAATPEPGVGAPVRDGTLEFTVTGFACGQERIGVPPFDRAAQGVYCLVDVEVANVGDAARRVPANQLLFDVEDREYEMDGAVPWLLPDGGLWDPVNPGNRVRGTLAFDVPPGLVPVRVELHGGWFTGGAAVRLDAPG